MTKPVEKLYYLSNNKILNLKIHLVFIYRFFKKKNVYFKIIVIEWTDP